MRAGDPATVILDGGQSWMYYIGSTEAPSSKLLAILSLWSYVILPYCSVLSDRWITRVLVEALLFRLLTIL